MKKRWFVCLFLGLIVASISIYWVWKKVTVYNIYGFQPPEMALAQYTPKDVVGDLGGMKVLIPRHYPEYVEYDGDPGFGEKRKGSRPKRTFDSRLTSFGIDVRFPDMKGLENAQLRKERNQRPWNKNNWFHIGINAGEIYPGDGFLDRRTNATLFAPESKGRWAYAYERMPEDEHGLEVWRLSDIDPRTNKPARESDDARDIYIHRDTSGKVDTYISCSRSRPNVPNGTGICELGTHLEPKAKVKLSVRFRCGLLSEWQKIRQSARDLLLSFEVKPDSSASSQ